MPHVLAATRPMPETRWQCLDFCGKTPAAGDRVGRGSRVPQHGGSTPPNASGAMAMPQDLWHRTPRKITRNLTLDLATFTCVLCQ